MRVACLALLSLGLASAARLRSTPTASATVGEKFPFAALLEEWQARGDEVGSTDDPHWMHVNKRLFAFRDAIHHMAIQEKAARKANATKMTAKANATKVKAKKENNDDEVAGHVFELVAEDKTCEPIGTMGSEKGVTAEDGCKELCASMAGCVAFAFSLKPFKQCEFFSECTEADANKIRKYKLYAIKTEDGDIIDSETCGMLPDYPNSKIKNFKDMAQGMSSEPKAFVAGDKIKYKCDRDHTIDGSKDGDTEYEVTCMDQGHFAPDRHGCVGASECGPMPCIRKAHPSGKVKGSKKNPIVEMVCDAGYSLDGEKVVPGGHLNNARLYLECLDTGKWSPALDYLDKRGKACEPFAFVPASNMIKMYNKVFQVLFIASCNTELSKWAEEEEKMPPKLEDGTVCSENVADDKEGDCKSLVDDLKDLFDDAKGQAQGFDAKVFCTDMWNLLKMEEPAALTDC